MSSSLAAPEPIIARASGVSTGAEKPRTSSSALEEAKPWATEARTFSAFPVGGVCHIDGPQPLHASGHLIEPERLLLENRRRPGADLHDRRSVTPIVSPTPCLRPGDSDSRVGRSLLRESWRRRERAAHCTTGEKLWESRWSQQSVRSAHFGFDDCQSSLVLSALSVPVFRSLPPFLTLSLAPSPFVWRPLQDESVRSRAYLLRGR
jgi:hypothetical protein